MEVAVEKVVQFIQEIVVRVQINRDILVHMVHLMVLVEVVEEQEKVVERHIVML